MAETAPTTKTTLPGPIELAKEALEIYKKRFWIVAGVFFLSLLLIIGYVGIGAVAGLIIYQIFRANLNFFSIGVMVLLGGALLLGLIWIANWIQAAYVVVIRDWEKGTGVRASLRAARPYIWPLLGATLLSGLLVLGGTFLFVIPGILLSIWFSFVEYPVVVEGRSGLLALHTSRQLYRGRFWRVIWRQIAVHLPEIALSLLLTGLIWANLLPETVNGLYQFISILLIPFYMAYTFILYSHLRRSTPDISTVPNGSKRVYLGIPLLGVILFIVAVLLILPAATRSAGDALRNYALENMASQKVKPGTAIAYGLIQFSVENGRYPESLDELIESGLLDDTPVNHDSLSSYEYKVDDGGRDFRLCTPEDSNPKKCVTLESDSFDL